MKNIKMCDDEIIAFFEEDGKFRIKKKMEQENKVFVKILSYSIFILFIWVPILTWAFEKLSNLLDFIGNGITIIKFSIERFFLKRKYLKSYIIPSKNEIKECYKRNFDEE